jgi:acylphosphatase
MTSDIVAVHVHIEGKVQRVWFRAWTIQEATERGLAGWVRNRADGSVEALFAGPQAQVKDMVAACWGGPPKARVDKITSEPADVPAEAGFHELPDA